MSRTFSIWKRNFLSFSAVSLILRSPMLVATLALSATGRQSASLQGVLNILSILLGLLVSGALTFGVLRSLAGGKPRLSEMVSAGLSRFGTILVISLAVMCLVVVSLLLCLIPAAFVMTAVWVAIPAAVAEARGTRSALKRSTELTKGHRLKIFLVLLLFFAIGVLVAVPITFFGATLGVIASLFFSEMISIVVGSLGAAAPAVGYHDLRLLKEGVQTEQLAAIFE